MKHKWIFCLTFDSNAQESSTYTSKYYKSQKKKSAILLISRILNEGYPTTLLWFFFLEMCLITSG